MDLICDICSRNFVYEDDRDGLIIMAGFKRWVCCSKKCKDSFWNSPSVAMYCERCNKYCKNGKYNVQVVGENSEGFEFMTAHCSQKCKDTYLEGMEIKCENCLSVSINNKITCETCEHSYYCSKKCRTSHKKTHQRDCKKW